MFEHPAWRERPMATAFRFVSSQARKRVPGWNLAFIPYDGGRSRLLVDVRTTIGYSLYRYGYDDPDIDLIRALVQPGDWVIDGGAHIGLYGLVAAAQTGRAGRVIALEPAEETRTYLKRNVERSGFTWMEVRPQALAETAGRREFVSFAAEAWGSSSFAPLEDYAGKRVDVVETVTLDSLVSPEERKRVRFVKLDLEGAEAAALLGGQALIREAQPDFMLEISPEHLEKQGASVADIERLFRAQGYVFYRAGWDARRNLTLTGERDPGRRAERPNVFISRDVSRLAARGVVIRSGEEQAV